MGRCVLVKDAQILLLTILAGTTSTAVMNVLSTTVGKEHSVTVPVLCRPAVSIRKYSPTSRNDTVYPHIYM